MGPNTMRRLCLRERRIKDKAQQKLTKLDHPNIVKLIDVFEDERHWCLVMELMQGGEVSNLTDLAFNAMSFNPNSFNQDF